MINSVGLSFLSKSDKIFLIPGLNLLVRKIGFLMNIVLCVMNTSNLHVSFVVSVTPTFFKWRVVSIDLVPFNQMLMFDDVNIIESLQIHGSLFLT